MQDNRTIIAAAPSRMFLNIQDEDEIAKLRALNEDLLKFKTQFGEAMSKLAQTYDIAIRQQQGANEQLQLVNNALRSELRTLMWDNKVDRELKIQFLKEKNHLQERVVMLEQLK